MVSVVVPLSQQLLPVLFLYLFDQRLLVGSLEGKSDAGKVHSWLRWHGGFSPIRTLSAAF